MTVSQITCKYRISLVLSLAAAIALAACGGNGDGTSSGSKTGSGSNTGGNSAASPTVKAGTFTPTPKPTPTVTLTPTPLIIVANGASILAAVHRAAPGTRVNVAPGIYAPLRLSASDVQGPITVVADVSGTVTGSGAHPVIIDADMDPNGAAEAAVTLSGIPADSAIVLDGFTLRGATSAGVIVEDSPGSVVQNCTLSENLGDGALFAGSDEALLLNNLIITNGGAGVRVVGTSGIGILNNTVYANTGAGISIGDAGQPSPNAQLENNIISNNGGVGIAVAANSLTGYQEDFDLNNDGATGPPGEHDLPPSASPLFVFPSGMIPDFHLLPSSPGIDAGDPNIDVLAMNVLQRRSTSEDGTPDCDQPNLGYHYPTRQLCAIFLSSPTPVATKKKPTPTPTPR